MSSYTGKVISPSTIGRFYNLKSCRMFLNWEYSEPFLEALMSEDRDWTPTDVGPLLSETGNEFEQTQVDSIVDGNTLVIADREDALTVPVDNTWDIDPDDDYSNQLNDGRSHFRQILERLKGGIPAETILLHQAPMRERLFEYRVGGFADLVRFTQGESGLQADVIEIKSSDEPKVPHQLQAVTYTLLLEEAAADVGLELEECTTRVVTESGRLTQGLIPEQEFEEESRKSDVKLFLQEDGILDQALDHSEFDDPYTGVRNRIGPRCSNCSYEPMCLGRMAEKEDYGLELLQLEPETQQAIEGCGVDSLRAMADLYTIHTPDDDGPSVSDFTELEPSSPEAEDKIQRIKEETNLDNLQTRAQIADRFVRELDSSTGDIDYFTDELQGSGYHLPADSYHSNDGDDEPDSPVTRGDVPWDSLIRVYIHVQHDPILDRITGLAAHIDCSTVEDVDDYERINPLTHSLNDSVQVEAEKDLLHSFFGQISDRINTIAPDLSGDYEDAADTYDTLDEDDGFVHLYLYSNAQRERLMDAVRRHNELRWSPPIRRLLGFRRNIDQGMVSVIEDELVRRHALRFPGLGLPQTVSQFKEDDWFDWSTDRSDGTGFTPGEYFDEGLFESAVSKHRESSQSTGEVDGFEYGDYQSIVEHGQSQLRGELYPIIHRNIRQLPPEYIYAAFDKLEERLGVDVSQRDDPELSDDERAFLERVLAFQTRVEEDPLFGEREQISKEDTKLLMSKFAEAIKFIERSVRYRDQNYQKSPVSLSGLTQLEPVESSLAETCIEYQQLEHQEKIDQVESHLRKPIGERLNSGESLLFECTSVPADEKEDSHIEGRLVNENFNIATGDELSNSPINVDTGDWKVLSRVERHADGRPEVHRSTSPDNMKHSPVAIIEELDLENGEITVTMPWWHGNFPNSSHAYMLDHNRWEAVNAIDNEEDDFVTQLAEGEYYIIDDLIDDISAGRAYSALEACIPEETDTGFEPPNTIYRTLNDIYHGNSAELTIDQWATEDVSNYLELLEQRIEDEGEDCEFNYPNEEQVKFIEATDLRISTLQGPPGTGKTSTSSAPSILSRMHAADSNGEGFAGIVSAYSHEAVEEVLEDVHELSEFAPPSGDYTLVRVNPKADAETHPNVEYLNYHDDSDDDEEGESDRLASIFQEYVLSDEPNQVVFFGPPVSLRGLLNTVANRLAGDESAKAEDLYETGECAVFDFGLIDEASMMDLPLMFLFGAFLHDDAQLQLVGDHQQMQPIQQHDWEAEDRKSLEENPPFLSTLDFIRFLRDDLEEEKREYFDRNPPEWEAIGAPDEGKDDLLPIHRLVKTYRLPAEAARFHTDLIYYPRDDIVLDSQIEHDPIELSAGVPDELETIWSPSDRVTVIVHEDDSAVTYSEVEADIIERLLSSLDVASGTAEGGSGYTTGVVVPYNDQVKLLRDRLSDDITVDTVEQFQGDQREVMILSMTGGAPGHVTSQSEFLQNPHRLNVGASRMQRKVVILASRSIFEAVIADGNTNAYDEQALWKRIYQTMGGFTDGEDARYDLAEFTDEVSEGDVNLRVFNGWPEDSIHDELNEEG